MLSSGGGEAVHAIPVSTALRAGARRIVLVLSRRRETLRRLRAQPTVALTVLAADAAFTAHARARVLADPLPGSQRMVAVTLQVQRIQDHRQDDFAMDDGARWHWTDPAARERDAGVRAALRALIDG